MTWLDFVVILLIVAGGVLEAHRGLVCAVIDCAGMGLLVWLLAAGHRALSAGVGISPSLGYLLLFIFGTVALIVTSTVADLLLKWDAGGMETAAGGILGVAAGYFLAHGVVSAFVVGYGHHWPPYSSSLLASECYNYRTYHTIITALQGLGGGPRIVDQVK
jgi:hypothetical protein